MYYISVLALIVSVCIVFEFYFKEHLFHSIKERLVWVSFALIFGTVWDLYAIPRGHWVFSGKGILGIYIFKVIPIEELLWFLVVPYFFITIYQTIKIVYNKK